MLRVSRGTDIAAVAVNCAAAGSITGIRVDDVKKRVIVIGAGAGGMMAAGRAAESGADVLLLERPNVPVRKSSSAVTAVAT